MPAKSSKPSHALVVTEYSEFRSLVRAHGEGAYELLAIVGPPGVAKTETVTRTMHEIHGIGRWGLIRGKHSPLDLYRRLHEHRLNPIVLDDLDGLLAKPDNTAILKCICDTKPVKRVEWGSTHSQFTNGDNPLPTSFDSISRVCIIANDLDAMNRNVAALHDRGVAVIFQPTVIEVHSEVAKGGWFDDPDVFDFIGRHLHLIASPSFRFYLTARDHKRAGLDWQSLVLRTMETAIDPATLLVAKLLADPRFDQLPAPEAAREAAFKAEGGGSRATYHRHKQSLLASRGGVDFCAAMTIKLGPKKTDPVAFAAANLREHLEQLRSAPCDADEHSAAEPVKLPAPPQLEVANELDDGPIRRLERQMLRAIAREDYESAARIRDEIRRLRGLDSSGEMDLNR
jgi:hypothetical protein